MENETLFLLSAVPLLFVIHIVPWFLVIIIPFFIKSRYSIAFHNKANAQYYTDFFHYWVLNGWASHL